jgi:hypothetical protein|tara:strand:- start:116 stop:547 length:432 start_codon:yes stop_codon:yes gene_type:complete
MQGFIVNDADVASVGTSYALGKAILLHEDSTADAKSRAMPQSCYLSHLDLQLDETSSTVAQVSAFLTWDSIGDDPMTGESASNALWTGLTDTSLRNTSIALDVWVTAPTGQTTAGKCYLFIKVDAGAVTVKKARLHWSDRANV